MSLQVHKTFQSEYVNEVSWTVCSGHGLFTNRTSCHYIYLTVFNGLCLIRDQRSTGLNKNLLHVPFLGASFARLLFGVTNLHYNLSQFLSQSTAKVRLEKIALYSLGKNAPGAARRCSNSRSFLRNDCCSAL